MKRVFDQSTWDELAEKSKICGRISGLRAQDELSPSRGQTIFWRLKKT
jgi:hypothetical protein